MSYHRKRTKRSGRTCHILIRDISEAVRDQFKAVCAKKGTSMTREIENFMRERVRAHNEEAVT